MDTRWDNIVEELIQAALEKQKQTLVYTYRKQREQQIDEMLTTNLTKSEKVLVEEVLFELGIMQEQESAFLYRQGLQDGVWLLKQLGASA